MMIERKAEIARKLDMSRYLQDLSLIVGRPVSAAEIEGLDSLEKTRSEAMALLSAAPTHSFRLGLSERDSLRFRQYLAVLSQLNSSRIYVWTELSNRCGLFEIESLSMLNLQLDLELVQGEVLVLLAKNLQDRLTINLDLEDEPAWEIDTTGKLWSQARH